jgi:type I restriction enzyme S subunit
MGSAKLGKIAQINPRSDASLAPDDIVSFVPMAAVSAVTASVEAEERRSYAEVAKGYTAFRDGDLLVAKITPCFENNKIAHARLSGPLGFGSTEFHVVRPYPDLLDPRYALHFLRQDHVRADGERKMTGSAGQRRVPAQVLADLTLHLPPLPEQRRIAAILDEADALRAKRRAALAQLDEMAQAIFVEMFGDPMANPKGWPSSTLGQLAQKFSDGPFGSNLKSEHYVEDGVRVIRLQNIGVGKFIDDDRAYISEAHFGSLIKHECIPGDVLVGTLGDPNLRACIQNESLKKAINKADCVQIRVDIRKATAEFVCALLNNKSIEAMAQDRIVGQTRLRISMGRLRQMSVPVPPLDLQQAFSSKKLSLDHLEAGHRAGAKEAEALFTSLQHRAFRGEL